ncbi:MAG: hypothetical protein HC915_03480 [Anaerolineae bacterium]|nr:hypothetical protein [Anaerolineae bacterium]
MPDRKRMRLQVGIMLAVMAAGFVLGMYLVAAGALPRQYNLAVGEAVPDIDVPAGFEIEVFAKDLAAPRYMVVEPTRGTLLVAERGANRVVALPDPEGDGSPSGDWFVVAENLAAPTGLALDEDWLYVAEGAQVTRVRLGEDLREVERETIVRSLPAGRNENEIDPISHALLIHDETLYISMGASCAACPPDDPRRASVLAYDLDGSNERIFARGLYYVLGLAAEPATGTVWASNQGARACRMMCPKPFMPCKPVMMAAGGSATPAASLTPMQTRPRPAKGWSSPWPC